MRGCKGKVGRVGVGALMLVLTSSLSCGGSAGANCSAAMSGVDGTKRLDALTPDEKKKLCDFEVLHPFGGYGKSVTCPSGTVLTASADQAACLATFRMTCPVTVWEAEACALAVTCDDLIPAACAPFAACS